MAYSSDDPVSSEVAINCNWVVGTAITNFVLLIYIFS